MAGVTKVRERRWSLGAESIALRPMGESLGRRGRPAEASRRQGH